MNIITSVHRAEGHALRAGARYRMREYYQDQTETHRSLFGRRGTMIFAIRFFDAAFDEVGHYLVDLGSYTQFDKPRVWHEDSFVNCGPCEYLIARYSLACIAEVES